MQQKVKKESADAENPNEFAAFHNPFFEFAVSRRRENRHICFDDVAAARPDYSIVYMHNEWPDAEDDQDEGEFVDPFSEQNECEPDVIDGVLEQFQGYLRSF